MIRSRALLPCVLVLAGAFLLAPLTASDDRPSPAAPTPDVSAFDDQQPPPATTPPPVSAPVGSRNVQVDVTVKLEGTGTPVTKRMTLVGANDLVSMGRAGMDIPLTGQMGSQYRSVGLNVDARPRLVEGGRIGLMLKLEFSAIVKPEGAGPSGAPSFGSSKTELNLVLDSGKPLVVAQAADAEVGRGYTVEVKATFLK